MYMSVCMNVIFMDDIMTVRSLAGYAFPYSIRIIDIETAFFWSSFTRKMH